MNIFIHLDITDELTMLDVMTSRRWLVTGCSTGLGRALAENLARTGERVLATARNPLSLADLAKEHPANVVVAALDVRDPQQCREAVAIADHHFGGVDVLVNNAGYGQFGSVEEVSETELRDQFETNFHGPWRLTKLVLPQWRERHDGHAVFVSSLSGSMALPGMAAYTASKFALEGLAESLWTDTAALGVRTTILQLGGFATNYGKSLLEPGVKIEDYAPFEDEMLASVKGLAESGTATSPEHFALLVRKVVAMAEPPLRVPFGEGVEDYLALAMRAKHESFDKAIAAGVHQTGWVEE